MTISIIVQNLKCGGCVNTIISKLSSIHTISDLEVDLEDCKVSFSYKKADDALRVKEKLKNLGYPSVEESNTLTSKARSFVSCATGKLS